VRLEQREEAADDGFAAYRVELDGIRSDAWLRHDDGPDGETVTVDEGGWLTTLRVAALGAGAGHDGGGSGPTTPVPGTVTHVAVAEGEAVVAGQALVVLEAMKMEHTIRADADGVVAALHVSVGQSVDAHTVVATVEATS
jgi:propionyl-CoA carboxylase alpha chain